MKLRLGKTILTGTLLALAHSSHAALVEFAASGSAATDIQTAVNDFRTAVSLGGGNNGVGGGPFLTGRREINWDAAGLDAFQDPNVMPGNFFNNNSKRGAAFAALNPSGQLSVSVRSGSASAQPLLFGALHPDYPGAFQAFSPSRIFGVTGILGGEASLVATFFVPNDPATPATVNGFGAVFLDVDQPGLTKIEFFGAKGVSLGSVTAPVANNGFSFVGGFFDAGERVSSVRIESGNTVIGPNGDTGHPEFDVVAMDDFIYGEPLSAVPEPSQYAWCAALALLGWAGWRRWGAARTQLRPQ